MTPGGIASHTEGYRTITVGDYSHAEGMNTTAVGLGSHAEGGSLNFYGRRTVALGEGSHAEGLETTAGGWRSHTEGYQTVTAGEDGPNGHGSGGKGHAEGRGTTVIGYGAHTEGFLTTAATGSMSSHAEGAYTTTKGLYSHTEGLYTYAEGSGSHAEGSGSSALGIASHAMGLGTIASGSFQQVLCKYNIIHSASNDFLIIGNGTFNTRRDLAIFNQTFIGLSQSIFMPDLTMVSKPHVISFNPAAKKPEYSSGNKKPLL
mgnify:CR=1 FL=1